ncbi:Deoxyribonuclease-2-alpha [Trichinella pseudospiralis]|uniref:Deoxyribonuclease-2-alpha n=1 Tax=Trichinella pseudospiralis TaxID=6337 RepID=A0A0V1F6P1_TRIPS|nr:Deoxyribonuclease-2-alpha [Trichinella pseudospiralis]
MDTLSDGCILIWLVLNSLITIEACSTDDEEDLKKPVTNVVSENDQTEGSALYEEDDEEKPIWISMTVPAIRETPTSGLDVEYTAEMKYRVNEKGVVVCRPKLKKTVNVPDLRMNAVELSLVWTLVNFSVCGCVLFHDWVFQFTDRRDLSTSFSVSMLELLSKVLSVFLFINLSYSQTSKCRSRDGAADEDWAIVYKAPGQSTGKIILASAAGSWVDGNAPLSNNAGHSFAVTLQHVVANNAEIKFLAYNNVPPAVPNVKTKSNSKGVIIVRTSAGVDSAAWVVHTIPGFPTAKTPYTWPAAENARGHLLICLTISESQINAIAASLLLVQPIIYYNDIPESETAGMPYFKKLAEGQTPTMPPFTSRRSIRTQSAGAPVTVHIYSKSESSKYEIYRKVIVKALKKTIKVWSRRDNKLKGDCRVRGRHIRLLKSPGVINGHNTNLEADDTNWAVSDPGSVICHVDKPYFKNQSKEPAMAVCIENNDIFTRFNEIAAQLDDCP